MKKIACIVTALLLVFILAACSNEPVKNYLVDKRFTPAHTEIKTDYETKRNWLGGKWELVPNVHSEYVPDTYELCWRTIYESGYQEDGWAKVTKEEYDATEIGHVRLDVTGENKNG